MATPREIARRVDELEQRCKADACGGIALASIGADLGVSGDAFTPDGEDENGEPTVSVAQLIANPTTRAAIADCEERFAREVADRRPRRPILTD